MKQEGRRFRLNDRNTKCIKHKSRFAGAEHRIVSIVAGYPQHYVLVADHESIGKAQAEH